MAGVIAMNGRSARHRRQRSKNLALVAILLGVALLIYITYIVRAGAAG